MKLTLFLIFVAFQSFCESSRWDIQLTQDFDDLNQNYFDEEKYDVSFLRIEPSENQSKNVKQTVDFDFLKRFPRTENLDIFYWNFETFNEFKFGTKLTSLSMQYNKIKKLHKHQIRNLVNLEALNMDANQIETLCEGFLKNNKKLKWVYFTYNKITKIPTTFFEGLYNLEKVSLNDNKLTFVPSLFKDNKKLKEVNFFSNQILKIDPEILTGLTNIKDVYFTDNPCGALKACYEEWRQSEPTADELETDQSGCNGESS